MLRVAALTVLAVAVSGHPFTYKWNRDSNWGTSSNWEGGLSATFAGTVDLSQDCVNGFNPAESSGMAIRLDRDASAGTVRMPITGKLIFAEGKTLTLTGGNSGTKNWKCHEPITQSSACPENYKVFNGSTEINTTKAPCWEDTIVVDSNDAVSIKWQPGHIVGSVVVAAGWSTPSAAGIAGSSWPGNDVDFDTWSNMHASQFAGTSPAIDPTGTMALCTAEICPMFCLNTCPEADILDVDLFLQFGSNVTQDMIDDALDNAIVQRAALGRFRNQLHTALPGGAMEPLGYSESFSGLLGDLNIGLSGMEMATRLGNSTVPGWIPSIFFGWTPVVAGDMISLVKDGGAAATLADYNLAYHQFKAALEYLASLDGPPAEEDASTSMVQSNEAAFMENVVATSGHAAEWLEGDGITTMIGSPALRMYVRNYLTNNRAQMTATWYDNVTATGDVSSADWAANDKFNMSTSGGVFHHAQRRALASAGYVSGEQMKTRALSAANVYLAGFSGPNMMTQIQIESVQQIRCGSEHYLESSIPYAHGACNYSQVRLTSSQAVVQTDPNFDLRTSLLAEPVIAAVLGMVTTQMSMHAVGSELNESILRTDSAWAAFIAEDDEDEFPLMVIIIAAAAALVLCLLIAVIVLMGGKGGEKEAKDNRNVVAFENPMYDDPTSGGGGGGGDGDGDGDPGLYDEPTFQEAGKANPTYDSNENVAADGGGYLDVEPDDGEDDDDDDESDDDDE